MKVRRYLLTSLIVALVAVPIVACSSTGSSPERIQCTYRVEGDGVRRADIGYGTGTDAKDSTVLVNTALPWEKKVYLERGTRFSLVATPVQGESGVTIAKLHDGVSWGQQIATGTDTAAMAGWAGKTRD